MSINDYGGATDSLGSVPLGGPNGWAAAVASALDGSDTSVNARIASRVWDGTQVEYDALGAYDPNTTYFVREG